MDLDFRKNLGTLDRTLRIALGSIVLFLGILGWLPFSSTVNLILSIFAAGMLAEGLLGY